MVLKYLAGKAGGEACIDFSDDAYSTDRYQRNDTKEICASIKEINKGSVDFDVDGSSTESYTVSDGKVSETDIW